MRLPFMSTKPKNKKVVEETPTYIDVEAMPDFGKEVEEEVIEEETAVEENPETEQTGEGE